MNYLEPVYSYSMSYIPNVTNNMEDVIQKAKNHANKLFTIIKN